MSSGNLSRYDEQCGSKWLSQQATGQEAAALHRMMMEDGSRLMLRRQLETGAYWIIDEAKLHAALREARLAP